MAAVLALVPDLLFGSKVQAMLERAGHDVEIASSETDVWEKMAGSAILVVDLTADAVDGVTLVDSLKSAGEAGDVRILGFYSHVDTETRARAESAGFDLVVPRSRMAREGAQLVERLAAQQG
jgi:CheY-like chemotaxis protein